jgi:anti-sigma regulatory factor (Ser/Thr protein kinase)
VNAGASRLLLVLPGTVVAVTHARHTVVDTMRRWGFRDPDWLDTVTLIVTELVGNAVRHARGGITLDLLADGPVTLGVTDSSPVRPSVGRGSEDHRGLGLLIVDALCPRWGVCGRATGKRVWAELPAPPGR